MALKEMVIKKAGNNNLKQFIGEYEIINLLQHPNIVKAYGIFLSNSTHPPSILLEYLPTNLEKSIEDKKLTHIQIVIIIFQIVEGMKYVHFHKVIHRDLKPTNILIGNDGTVKICDFGISKLMTLEEQSMTRGVGTQKFMAPEIINEEEIYDEKVDVYSFGVLLYYILSGGQLPKIKLGDILKGKKAEIPSTFTSFAKEIINDCWNFKSKDRPSFKTILERMDQNDYKLLNLTNSEIKNVKSFVKQHKTKIPKYD